MFRTSLASEIPPSNTAFSGYNHPVSRTFTLKATTNDIVLKLINSLPLNKASGLDWIACRLPKEAAPKVVPSLTHTIHLSIITGIFPQTNGNWPESRPYTKKGRKVILTCYRPISDLGWDSLERRRSKQLAAILFKILHNLAPTRLNSLLKTTFSVQSHNLRNSKYNLFVPRPSTEAGKRSFQYRASVLWNSLPLSAKIQPPISSFKSSI